MSEDIGEAIVTVARGARERAGSGLGAVSSGGVVCTAGVRLSVSAAAGICEDKIDALSSACVPLRLS